MNFLVVNDDGYNATGIKILANALKKYGNVTVCGPESGRSASGHSIVLHGDLSFEFVEEKDGIKWYKTSGMPADCVRLCFNLLEEDFDIVFSGVNNGLNIGTDIIYSGTVAAAREAMIEFVASVAISTDFDSFDIVEKEIDNVLELVINKKLYSKEYVLNINFPISKFTESKGIKLAKQGDKIFTSIFSEIEPNLYSVVNEEEIHDKREDTDVYLADEGYVTLVPVQIDQTDYKVLNKLKELL